MRNLKMALRTASAISLAVLVATGSMVAAICLLLSSAVSLGITIGESENGGKRL